MVSSSAWPGFEVVHCPKALFTRFPARATKSTRHRTLIPGSCSSENCFLVSHLTLQCARDLQLSFGTCVFLAVFGPYKMWFEDFFFAKSGKQILGKGASLADRTSAISVGCGWCWIVCRCSTVRLAGWPLKALHSSIPSLARRQRARKSHGDVVGFPRPCIVTSPLHSCLQLACMRR